MFGPEGKMENLFKRKGVRHTLPEGLYSWMARTKWWAERKNSEALCLILARGQWGAFAVHTILVREGEWMKTTDKNTELWPVISSELLPERLGSHRCRTTNGSC